MKQIKKTNGLPQNCAGFLRRLAMATGGLCLIMATSGCQTSIDLSRQLGSLGQKKSEQTAPPQSTTTALQAQRSVQSSVTTGLAAGRLIQPGGRDTAFSHMALSQQQVGLLQEVNRIRQENGKRPLAINPTLSQVASHYAGQLAQRKRLEHSDPQGHGPDDRVTASGYRWQFVAENLAAGQATPQDVIKDWMNSPSHRSALLSEQPDDLGIGYVNSGSDLSQDPFLTYWVAVFAKPADASVKR